MLRLKKEKIDDEIFGIILHFKNLYVLSMKKIITFLMLCCITALFAPPEAQAQSAQTVNESGGAGLNDGLKFVVNTNGALAVYRDNRAQYYPGGDWSDVGSRNSGVSLTFRFSNGGNYSATTAPLQVCSTTPVVQTGSTYKTSISGYVNSTLSDDKFFVTLDVTYTHPNNYFMIDYIVRSPLTLSAAGQMVHMYLSHDAMILGCDASFGYRSLNNTGEFIGDYRPVNCGACPGPGNLTSAGKYKNPSSHGFKTNGGFRSYYTGPYSSRNGMNSTLELSNTYTTTMTDDGIAVEFTAGPFTQPNQTLVRSVAHCYGNDKTEFENLVINVPAAPAASTPITINFASADFSEIEGGHTAQNVKITVSGGILASDQVCSFTMSNGTAVQNTDYTYVKGFTIPAGNYTTPREFVLNNITIIDDSICNDSKWTNIMIDAPSTCNDMLILGNQSSAKITIKDNEPRPEITTLLPDTVYNTGDIVPSLSLTSDVADATISWTNSNPAIGLAASGTGDIPSFTAINTSVDPATATITVTAARECAGTSRTFTITVNSKFDITYDYTGGVAPATANPTEFLLAELPMNIVNAPTRTGYTFAGWTCDSLGITTPQNPFTIPAGTIQDVALVADWGSGANAYDIIFNVPIGNISNPNSDQTYTYEDSVWIADPRIPGYTFRGWIIENDSVSSPDIDPRTNVFWPQHTVYGNLTFSVTAPSITDTTCWLPNDYSITYDHDGGNAPVIPNPVIYNALTPTIYLNAPTRDGYTFKGWTITNTNSDSDDIVVALLSFTQVIPTGTHGNLLCKAHWQENSYRISYELNGATHSQTPTSYLFTNQTTVANPSLAGYTFMGWTIENDSVSSPVITPTTNVTFGPSTVFGNLTFTVPAPPEDGGDNDNWNQITYTITYNLDGGTHGADHPESYTVTDSVFISVPTKSGYTFAGWTIENDSTSSPLPTSGNPTIFGPSNGVYGNLIFTATWSTDAYTITYNPGAADASFTNNTNPGTYNIEDSILLTDAGAKRNGYTFTEWEIISSEAGVTIPNGMTIPAGTHGNLTSTAQWIINDYNITFSVPSTVANPNSNRSYTYEDSVTIANPTVPGYTFTGWTIVNDSVSSPAISSINSNWPQHTVYGNVTFSVTDPTAPADPTVPSNWNTIEYDITYELDGGTPPATANPAQYDVQTPTITLNAPTRTGYTFTGWTIESDSTAVTFTNPTNTIPAGSYGNLTCTANWGIDAYAITYDVAPGITHALTPTGYTFEDSVTIADPILTGYTFLGWTITNDAPSAPAITPAKNVQWMPNTVYGNLTMKVEFPTSDITANWTKDKYKVMYDWNNGTTTVITDPNSPYVWGTTVTIPGNAAGMIYTDAMYLGWSSTMIDLITTQDQEDALPTLIQAGNTFVMPQNDTTFYAVWAIDASGPNGGPDSIPDYKQVAVKYEESTYVTASSGRYPDHVMFNKNTTGTVAGNTGNLQAASKILIGWSTSNVASISATGSLPSGMYAFGASISIGTTDITLYAVWADDNNGNGVADFQEQTGTTTPGAPPSAGTNPTTPGRPRPRSSELKPETNNPKPGKSLMTQNMTTRNSEDTWFGWNSDWDILNPEERAFADDCKYYYEIIMDTLPGSRQIYDILYPTASATARPGFYESWIEYDSWLIWGYKGDWNSDQDSTFVINWEHDFPTDGSPYNDAGQFLDSVFIPGGTYLASDYVLDPDSNIIHGFTVKDQLAPGEYWRGSYDPYIKLNPELITKLNNGGELKLYYYVRAVDSTNTLGNFEAIGEKIALFKHVYKHFELTDTVISQYISPAGKLNIDSIINYGSPDLKRSINGGAWNNAYAPLTNREQLAVNDGVDIRLRDPGDECSGKIIHFNEIKTPTIQRKVTIHSIDGVIKTYPEADMEHYVEGNKEFTFVITFADEALKVMAHGFYSGKKEELIGDSIGANTFQYTVYQVVEPINIYITAEPASATTNDVINGSSNVWTYGNTLYIRSIDGAAKADIYNISGSLLKQLNLNSDITEEVMERGAYVIKLGNEHYKVIIR